MARVSLSSINASGWRRIAVLALAYAASMAYHLYLAGAMQGVATIWTANAVVIAGMMALPRREGLVLLAVSGVLHAAFQFAQANPPSFVVAVVLLDLAAEWTTAALILGLGLSRRSRTMRDLVLLTGVATAFTVAASTAASAVLARLDGRGVWDGWFDWIVPNTMGVAVMLPIMLVLMDRRLARGFPAGRAEVAATALATTAFSFAFYWSDAPFRIALLGPALFAAFRGGPRATALTVMGSLGAAIPALLWRMGSDRETVTPALHSIEVGHIAIYLVCMGSALVLARQARLQELLARGQAAARSAQARAQAASQAKSDFLATMSHEIRTPLNSILGFAELVAEDPGLSDESRRRLHVVRRAGRSLADLVSDILDFSRMGAGRLELAPAPASPAAILRDAVAIVEPAARAKDLSLTVEVETRGATAASDLFALDEGRLRQALLNLLANAVKFTEAGSVRARLVLGPGAGQIEFAVIDTGIGIAPELQARLFRRFTQADGTISRRYGGAGLGLAISKALVGLMGGDIGVESAPAQGSRFWIRLAATPVEAPGPAPAPGEGQLAGGEGAGRPIRVLLVDDHPMNRELGEAMLVLAGCIVTTADDGAAAVEAARRESFDVVLMDLHMPGMDGFAATRAIRALAGPAAATPVLAVTADVRPEQVRACLAAGMNGHLAKPINRELLLARIAQVLEEEAPAARRAAG
jgi:signal transduction histidine kinase/ActR/RegA family two-component response regulator